jgi:heterokaryon incompatibility protein (HET)
MFETLTWFRVQVLRSLGLDVNHRTYKDDALGKRQIRLLTLKRGYGAARLDCKLKSVPLDGNIEKYIALSWVWGPNTKDYMVLVNDTEHWISSTLYDMLIALRQKDKEQTFWLDAICINQENKIEKDEQVLHMTEIYTGAEKVVVWLREADDDTKYSMECIALQDTEKYDSARFLKGIAQIMLRPWFSRTWVVQEFALNQRTPELYVGPDSKVTWDEFFTAFNEIKLTDSSRPWADVCRNDEVHGPETMQLILQWLLSPIPPNVASFRASFVPMRKRCQLYSEDWDRELSRTLMALQSLKVTEPRDKIIGGLGLVTQGYKRDLDILPSVKGGGSLEQLHREITVYLLQSEQTLLYAYFKVHQDKQPGRPSWVLDFSSPRGIPLLADTGLKLGEISRVDISDDQTLKVEAIFVDHIEHLVGPLIIPPRIIPSEFPRFLYPVVWISYVKLLFQRIMMLKFNAGLKFKELKDVVHTITLVSSARSILTKIERLLNNTRRKDRAVLPEELWKTLLATTSTNKQFTKAENTFQKEYDDFLGTPPSDLLPNLGKLNNSLFSNICLSLYQRCFFAGKRGFYGIAERTIKKGDQLVLLFPPIWSPFIIRPKGDHFQLVSVAYMPPKDHENVEKKPRESITIV